MHGCNFLRTKQRSHLVSRISTCEFYSLAISYLSYFPLALSPLSFLAMRNLSRFLAVGVFSLFGTANSYECYWPNGVALNPPYLACNSTASVSSCCAPTDACTSEGWCLGSAGMVYRGACTDRTWKSPICQNQYCTDNREFFEELMSCNGGDPGAPLTWCCGTAGKSGSCCTNNFSLPSASDGIGLTGRTWLPDEVMPKLNASSTSTVMSTATATATVTTSPTPGAGNGGSKQNAGALAGVAIAGVIGGVLIGGAIAYFLLKKKFAQTQATAPNPAMPPAPFPFDAWRSQDPMMKYELPVERRQYELDSASSTTYSSHGTGTYPATVARHAVLGTYPGRESLLGPMATYM